MWCKDAARDLVPVSSHEKWALQTSRGAQYRPEDNGGHRGNSPSTNEAWLLFESGNTGAAARTHGNEGPKGDLVLPQIVDWQIV
jgi:hypothetical protein